MLTDEERKRRNAERTARWREKNPDRARAGVKAWCDRFPEKKAASDKAYREANSEKCAAREKQWREAHKDQQREYFRRYNQERKEQNREKRYQRQYGITIAQYDAMLVAQKGTCAVCPKTEPGGRGKYFHVDHDHDTGKVRGLLCHEHNTALRSSEEMRKLVSYMDKPTI